jgi:hypothetical protein
MLFIFILAIILTTSLGYLFVLPSTSLNHCSFKKVVFSRLAKPDAEKEFSDYIQEIKDTKLPRFKYPVRDEVNAMVSNGMIHLNVFTQVNV